MTTRATRIYTAQFAAVATDTLIYTVLPGQLLVVKQLSFHNSAAVASFTAIADGPVLGAGVFLYSGSIGSGIQVNQPGYWVIPPLGELWLYWAGPTGVLRTHIDGALLPVP